MSMEEKSLFDEIWDAAGLPKQEETKAEEPTIEIAEEPAMEPIVEEPIVEEPTIEEPVMEEAPVEEPKPEAAPIQNDHTTKKKDVKFLVIYTIAFVLVVAALISGCYMISNRFRQEMNESGESDISHSKLQNIQDKNKALTEKNQALTASQAEADALIDAAGDMVEQNEYLAAAMSAHIKGNRAEAKAIFATIDREKLSPTYQDYYDALQGKLG